MNILDWMEQTAIAEWVGTSPAGYYIMLAFHSLGLAMIVGTVSILDLRLLGLVRGIALQAAVTLVKFAWFGLAMNVASGAALFFSEANKEYYSWSFRIKFSLMLLGVLSTVILNNTVYKAATINRSHVVSANAKIQALVSLLLWLSVIVVGRMNSYLTEFTVTH